MVKTLKGRISLIYLGLVMMIALIGLNSAWNSFRLSHMINGLMNANYKSIKVCQTMTDAVGKQDYSILSYITVDEKQSIRQFLEQQKAFQSAYYVESHNITEAGETKLVQLLDKTYFDFLMSFSSLQEIYNHSGQGPALAFHRDVIRPQITKIKKILNQISTLNEKAMFSSKNRVTANAKHSTYVSLIISLIAVCGGFSAALYLFNRFFKPIKQLTETVKLVQAGDLNRKVPIVYHDETGELANEFNLLTQRLLQYEKSTIGQLMSEKNKSLTIVKSISDPLIVLDPNYRFILANDAAEQFFGFTENQAINKHFLEVVRNGELFEYISEVSRSPEKELHQKIMTFSVKGKENYFNVVVKTVLGNENTFDSIIVLFQNITQSSMIARTFELYW